MVQKTKGMPISAGLLFTEEDSRSGWVSRQAKDLKLKFPDNFDKLENFSEGHKFECFHNLDIDVINAETRTLHYSFHLFFERNEVKEKLHSLLGKFVMVKDVASLKMRKLTL